MNRTENYYVKDAKDSFIHMWNHKKKRSLILSRLIGRIVVARVGKMDHGKIIING
jgi:hypothetical protein